MIAKMKTNYAIDRACNRTFTTQERLVIISIGIATCGENKLPTIGKGYSVNLMNYFVGKGHLYQDESVNLIM